MPSSTIIYVRAGVLVVIVCLCVAAISVPSSLYTFTDGMFVPGLGYVMTHIKVGMFETCFFPDGGSAFVYDTADFFVEIGFTKAEAHAIQASAILALLMAVSAVAAFFMMAFVGTCTTGLKCLVIFLDILAGFFMLAASAIIIVDYERVLKGYFSDFGDLGSLGPGMPLLVVSMVLSFAMTCTSCCFSLPSGYNSIQ